MTPQQKAVVADASTCAHIYDADLFFVTRHGQDHYSANWLLQDADARVHKMGEFKTRGAAYLCIMQQFVVDHFDSSDVMLTVANDTSEQYQQGLKLSEEVVGTMGALVKRAYDHERDVLGSTHPSVR